jgi:membrane-associated protein
VLAEVAAVIAAYRYLAIFPIALFDAPLMSIVVGFFAQTGALNLYLAFGIVVLGDIIGDTVLYMIGRWHRTRFMRLGPRLNLSSQRVQKVLDYFGRYERRAIVFSKLVHGVGFTGLIAAGSLHIPFRRFIATCVMVTVCQSAVLTGLGMLSGRAYQAFAHVVGYIDAVVAAIVLIGLFIAYRTMVDRISGPIVQEEPPVAAEMAPRDDGQRVEAEARRDAPVTVGDRPAPRGKDVMAPGDP